MQAAVRMSTDRAVWQFAGRPRRRPWRPVGCSGRRLDREQATRPGLAASCARRLGDAVDAAALLFGRSEGEPELLLQGSRKDAAHGMTLPAGDARHLVDRCALGLTQHGNHHVLLRRALWVVSRLRIGQGLDCRPQLLDQRLAVANLSPLIDTRQRVPQCQKPLAAERRRVQFFLRRDDNLALTDCGRRLAAQRDAVIADDVAAHGGFSWLVRRPAAASGPTHALFAAQSHSFVDNLVALLRYRRALDCSPANCMRLVLISRFTPGFWYQADTLACLPSF